MITASAFSALDSASEREFRGFKVHFCLIKLSLPLFSQDRDASGDRRWKHLFLFNLGDSKQSLVWHWFVPLDDHKPGSAFKFEASSGTSRQGLCIVGYF
jgi:hypothetical protein